jgi:mercuric ion binding protein
MKTKLLFFSLLIFSLPSFAQSKIVTANIKVYGNCVMCKKRIETALDHKGIKKADWNPKTKNLQVTYNSSKITEQEIAELVAAVGHDTDKVKAKDEDYASLPFCCLYRDSDHAMRKDGNHQ